MHQNSHFYVTLFSSHFLLSLLSAYWEEKIDCASIGSRALLCSGTKECVTTRRIHLTILSEHCNIWPYSKGKIPSIAFFSFVFYSCSHCCQQTNTYTGICWYCKTFGSEWSVVCLAALVKPQWRRKLFTMQSTHIKQIQRYFVVRSNECDVMGKQKKSMTKKMNSENGISIERWLQCYQLNGVTSTNNLGDNLPLYIYQSIRLNGCFKAF